MENIVDKYRVSIRAATKEDPRYTVSIAEYKFDNIRQESYWVTVLIKSYRLRSDAETFAKRYGWVE